MISFTTSNELIQYIESKDRVSTKELIDVFHVSAPTIYRIFEKMREEGKLKRVHGGAVVVAGKEESLFDKKLRYQLEQKKAICAYVAKHFIKEDDVVGIDSGTTAYHLIDYIEVGHVTIITNGLRIASHAAQMLPHANIVCSGGIVRSQLSVCVGTNAREFFKNKRINILFLTCSGVEPARNTIYEVDALIAEVKRMMMSVALRVVLLVTSDKMNTPSFSYLNKIENVDDIVCDDEVNEEVLQLYKSFSPTLHIAQKL